MNQSPPLTIEGKPVGHIKAGWLLCKETWRFLMLDKELLWIPVISLLANFFLFGLLIAALIIVATVTDIRFVDNSFAGYGVLFLVYVISAFVLAFSQAAISHIVYVRVHGGDATLGEGLRRASAHGVSLFLWSVITSTVGVILQAITNRSQLLGKLVASLMGAAWAILTYFVVPAMVIDNHSAFASIPKSAQVFKQTWGETIVSNISYNLIFVLLGIAIILSGGGLIVGALVMQLPVLAVLFLFVAVAAFVFLALVSSVFAGILKTLLYVYAAEGTVPQNFNRELLEKMLAKQGATAPAPQATMTSAV